MIAVVSVVAALMSSVVTDAAAEPRVRLFLNQHVYYPGETLAASVVSVGGRQDASIVMCLWADFSGLTLYWPTWRLLPYVHFGTIRADEIGHFEMIAAQIPPLSYPVYGTLNAALWRDDGGIAGDLLDASSISFIIEPRATAVPPTPTPIPATPPPSSTPTPPPSAGCSAGSVVISLAGIPQMNDANKDALNKQALFCIVDSNHTQMVAVIHRYYQPGWPYGPWESVWRLEAPTVTNPDQYVWWTECGAITSANATFEVSWEGDTVRVECLQTGDIEELETDHDIRLAQIAEDGDCQIPGYAPFASEAYITGSPRIDCRD